MKVAHLVMFGIALAAGGATHLSGSIAHATFSAGEPSKAITTETMLASVLAPWAEQAATRNVAGECKERDI
jgi:hypothetical protein